jgi:hypothetical protein
MIRRINSAAPSEKRMRRNCRRAEDCHHNEADKRRSDEVDDGWLNIRAETPE